MSERYSGVVDMSLFVYMLTELQTAKIITGVAKLNILLLFEICSKYNVDYYLI